MEEINACLNVVLLGKTGAGKSAAGNTILGQQAFISKKSPKSVTQNVSKKSNTVCGCPVTVYDTPGYFDTDLTENEIQLKYQGIFQECESGHCVFLLVIKTDRFTEEERKTVEKIEKLLGQNRLNKTWILFTGGDQLEEENKTIKEFINDTEPLKKLVQKYEQRYHVFNNKKKRQRQVQMLLTKFQKCIKTNGAKLNPLTRKLPKKAEPAAPVSSLSSRRITLLGKSGVGKSATANTILGQKVFRSVRSTKSVTSECSVAHATVSGRSVSVVDTPGFFDTQMKPEELVVEIARSVYISSPGPHAFLIVFRVDDRFTEHEQQIPQIIEMMFGQEVLKYSIILFTHGDQLEGQTVDELIKENSSLRDLVDQCGGRFHVFNNKKRNREQVNDLLQKIDSMIEQNGGGHYSNEMLEDAHRFREEEEEQRLREEEEQRQKKEEERRLREEEERKQQEKQRQEEIERVRKVEEERIRAEMEAKLERLNTERQREEEERKREEKQLQEENERVRKEAEERIKAEMEAQRNELERLQAQIQNQNNETKTSSWFNQFFHKYRYWFYTAACVIDGLAIGGLAIGSLAFGGLAFGGVITGLAVIGGVIGCAIADHCEKKQKQKTKN